MQRRYSNLFSSQTCVFPSLPGNVTYVTLTNINLRLTVDVSNYCGLSRGSALPASLRPIVNQIALASQMHIHGKRMADYAGSVAHPAYRAAMGCFAFPARKGVPRYIYRSKTTRLDGIGLASFTFSSPYFLPLCLVPF